MGHEWHLAWRFVARNRSVSLGSVLAVAIGIGVVTAMFAITYPLVFAPQPFADADRLGVVYQFNSSLGIRFEGVAPLTLADWRRQATTFSDLASLERVDFTYPGHEGAAKVKAARVSGNFFPMLGVPASLGRTFSRQEEGREHTALAVLGQSFWRTQLGADVGILGKFLQLEMSSTYGVRGVSATSYQVVGILRDDFRTPAGERIDVWVPQTLEPERFHRDEGFLTVLGRLEPGHSWTDAQAEMRVVAERLARDFPETNRGWGAQAEELRWHQTAQIRPVLKTLSMAAVLVLAAAGLNLVLLVVAVTERRTRELGLRASLGAGSWALVRQCLAESGLLALLAAVAGLLLSSVIVGLVRISAAGGLWELEEARIGWGALAVGFVLTFFLTSLFALIPLLLIRRRGIALVTRGGVETSLIRLGSGQRLLIGGLVAIEVAAAGFLISVAAGLGSSFRDLSKRTSGLREQGALAIEVALPKTRYRDPASRRTFFSEALTRLSGLPEIQAVGTVDALPFTDSGASVAFTVEGSPAVSAEQPQDGALRRVSDGYFAALGIPLVAGRSFQAGEEAFPYILVDEAFARRYWPGESAIGKVVQLGGLSGPASARQVMGVVGSVRHYGLAWEGDPTIYVQGHDWPVLFLVARASQAGSRTLAAQIRQQLVAMDSRLALTPPRDLEGLRFASLALPRLRGLLVSMFCLSSLALAVVGLASVIRYAVARRRHEIAIRRALGASNAKVIRLVVAETLRFVLGGVVVGAIATRVFAPLLDDPVQGLEAFSSSGLIFGALSALGVAWCALVVPARRATEVEPIEALRQL